MVQALRAEGRKETHINRALRALNAHTYVEIGVAAGVCFRQITAPRRIAVDPAPSDFDQLLAPGDRFFRMTSDEFFARHARSLFASSGIDVVLVDGYHEFTQALRDVLNLERFMTPGGVIFIHDCNPPTREHADNKAHLFWTGDVWKIACFFAQYRRDLSFFTLDLDWGLGVLTGFHSGAVEPPSPDNLEQCRRLDYDVLARDRKRILRLRPYWHSFLFLNRSLRTRAAQRSTSP